MNIRLAEEPARLPVERPDAPLDQNAFDSRTVLVFGPISDVSAAEAARRLIALDTASDDPITVWVSSPGGHVESGDTLHDLVRFVRSPITMIGTGWVGSAAAHLFLAAKPERRLCLPNTRFLIHQPSGGVGGQGTDIAIQAEQIRRIKQRIAKVISRETGNPLDAVLRDIERDYWLSAEEAIDYGLVSRMVERFAELQLSG